MINVGITDDHGLFRKSLILLVNSFPEMRVVLDAANGSELLKENHLADVDVILLDIQMPVMDGFETTTALKKLYPNIRILIVSQLFDRDALYKVLSCGAAGYISKSSDPSQLEVAIKTVFNNKSYFDPEISSLVHDVILGDKKVFSNKNPFDEISEKEFFLIKLVAQGYTNGEVAARLFVNIRTVEKYRMQIIEKTFAKNFTGVLLLAIKHKHLIVDDL